jgi:hypothetical protein
MAETQDNNLRSVCRVFSVLSVSAVAFVASGIGFANVGIAGGHGHSAKAVEADSALASDAKIRGLELGEYRIRAYYPVEAQKSTVRFVLHAAVATENFAEAQRVVDSRQHKLRDEVIVATRMTPLALFDEPGLTTFRRRLLVRLRRNIPELTIDDVFVSEFQLSVKSL